MDTRINNAKKDFVINFEKILKIIISENEKENKLLHINKILENLSVEQQILLNNYHDPNFGTLLQLAVTHNELEITNILLEHEGNINIKDNFGSTLVHLAAEIGSKMMFLNLYYKKADIISKDNEGNTPLHKALIALMNADDGPLSINERLACIQQMIICYSEKDLILINNKNISCKRLISNSFDKIIDLNIQLNILEQIKHLNNNLGFSPLHQAVLTGTDEEIATHLNLGASVDSTDRYGRTPLHYAASRGKAKAIRYLMVKASEKDSVFAHQYINAQDQWGQTALFHLVKASFNKENRIECIKQLTTQTMTTLAITNPQICDNQKKTIYFYIELLDVKEKNNIYEVLQPPSISNTKSRRSTNSFERLKQFRHQKNVSENSKQIEESPDYFPPTISTSKEGDLDKDNQSSALVESYKNRDSEKFLLQINSLSPDKLDEELTTIISSSDPIDVPFILSIERKMLEKIEKSQINDQITRCQYDFNTYLINEFIRINDKSILSDNKIENVAVDNEKYHEEYINFIESIPSCKTKLNILLAEELSNKTSRKYPHLTNENEIRNMICLTDTEFVRLKFVFELCNEKKIIFKNIYKKKNSVKSIEQQNELMNDIKNFNIKIIGLLSRYSPEIILSTIIELSPHWKDWNQLISHIIVRDIILLSQNFTYNLSASCNASINEYIDKFSGNYKYFITHILTCINELNNRDCLIKYKKLSTISSAPRGLNKMHYSDGVIEKLLNLHSYLKDSKEFEKLTQMTSTALNQISIRLCQVLTLQTYFKTCEKNKTDMTSEDTLFSNMVNMEDALLNFIEFIILKQESNTDRVKAFSFWIFVAEKCLENKTIIFDNQKKSECALPNFHMIYIIMGALSHIKKYISSIDEKAITVFNKLNKLVSPDEKGQTYLQNEIETNGWVYYLPILPRICAHLLKLNEHFKENNCIFTINSLEKIGLILKPYI